MNTQDPRKPVRLIDKRELLRRVPISYQSIWAKMQRGEFPRSRVLGGKIFWVEDEINDHLSALPVARLKGDAEPEQAA